MRLLLFDIDGTLLSCGPQVRGIFANALLETFGRHGDLAGFDFSGRTDPEIVRALTGGNGLGPDEIDALLPRMAETYGRALDAALDAGRMRVLPGVAELLPQLASRQDRVLGLLTGNWSVGARIKLGRLGLGDYFAWGAFGEDGPDRPSLLPVAWERARAATGRSFGKEDTLLIGDSVRDVACGRAHDVPVLAVATGTTPAAELAAAGAWRVVDDLAAAHEVLA